MLACWFTKNKKVALNLGALVQEKLSPAFRDNELQYVSVTEDETAILQAELNQSIQEIEITWWVKIFRANTTRA